MSKLVNLEQAEKNARLRDIENSKILSEEEMDAFLDAYIRAVDGRFSTEGLKERTAVFVPVTCLRGVTWCAMAWVEYQQPDKLIFNESTFRKLASYLEIGFLSSLHKLLLK